MIMKMIISKSHLMIKIVLAPVHRHLHEEEANMGRDDLGQPGDHPGREEEDDAYNGASPNSHKHFFPYMGSCASIWDNVRHHCHHHHHHHHHIQKSKSINTEACLIAH